MKNYRYQLTTFMLLTYVEKTSYFRLRRLVIPLLTKTVIIYEKMINIYYNLLCCLKIWCLRNVQIFIDLFWGVLILEKDSLRIFDNPSYMYPLVNGIYLTIWVIWKWCFEEILVNDYNWCVKILNWGNSYSMKIIDIFFITRDQKRKWCF